jgi:hypothetical protein
MIKTWKVAALVVFAAVSIASPALARDYATYHYSRGFGAFAMVPRTGGGRYSPGANGGGSPGYNWAVENDR